MERTTQRSNPVVVLALVLALALVLLALVWLITNTLDPQARAARAVAAYRDQQLANQLTDVNMITAAAWRMLPLAFVAGAGFVGLAAAWRRYVPQHNVDRHFDVLQTHAANQHPTVPHSLTYSPHMAAHQLAPMAPALLTGLEKPVELPGPVDLAALDFTPSRDRLLLGQLPGGELATTNISQLCHVAFCGATGGGKSNLMRLLLPQLQAIGAQVVLADPHYAPVDPENGDDWRAIAARLHMAPAVKPDDIRAMLQWLTDELTRRLERRNKGERVGAPLFFAFDELPVIIKHVPGAMDSISSLLREGRKVHLLTVGASQDFLVKTLGGSSAVRDAYRTAFYMGGDLHSAAALLDMPRRDVDDSSLGGGVAMLRSAATRPAQIVRVPLASNTGIARLLTADAPTMPDVAEFRQSSAAPVPVQVWNSDGTQMEPRRNPEFHALERAKPLTAEQTRILQLFRNGADVADIVKTLYPDISKGRATQDKSAEVQKLLRSAL